MAYIETLLSDIYSLLNSIGPTLSVIFIILSGLVFAFSMFQPSDVRGKWQTMAIGLFIGGVIIAAFVGGAEIIRETSSQLLT